MVHLCLLYSPFLCFTVCSGAPIQIYCVYYTGTHFRNWKQLATVCYRQHHGIYSIQHVEKVLSLLTLHFVIHIPHFTSGWTLQTHPLHVQLSLLALHMQYLCHSTVFRVRVHYPHYSTYSVYTTTRTSVCKTSSVSTLHLWGPRFTRLGSHYAHSTLTAYTRVEISLAPFIVDLSLSGVQSACIRNFATQRYVKCSHHTLRPLHTVQFHQTLTIFNTPFAYIPSTEYVTFCIEPVLYMYALYKQHIQQCRDH